LILGIVGSPRRNGRTNQLVERTLEGAASTGVAVQRIFLLDFDIRPYTEEHERGPEELSRLCEEADAIVLGAPVYYGDINGLTKDFMDTVRISNANGKCALGISMAGGTGKGLVSAIQSIYHFFYHRQLRGIDPTPVSRFNYDEALGSLYASGRRLAELSRVKKPFRDLAEVIEHHQGLPYMGYDFVEEILLLAEQLLKTSKSPEVARPEYEAAKVLIAQGKRQEAVAYAVKAYMTLYY